MRLTQKLLRLLHRVFDPDPERFLALRISHSAGLTWSVSDAVLATAVPGGAGQALSIDLTAYTIRQLIDFISQQPGYSVISTASSEQMSLGARTLIDGEGDIALSNGDHLYAYTSLLWAFLEPTAVELRRARAQIPEAIKQLSIDTAEEDWLDELGNLYGVPRQLGENDASYGPRIIAEVVRPRSNNVAIEKALLYYTGQATKVTDVVIYGDIFPLYDGTIHRNSLYNYQTAAAPRYGLFDVELGYDLLNGSDQTAYANRVRSIIEKIRAAGTHLRSLLLKGGSITDVYGPPPTDIGVPWVVRPGLLDSRAAPTETFEAMDMPIAAMSDPFAGADDDVTEVVQYDYRYNSLRRRDSTINYLGGRILTNGVDDPLGYVININQNSVVLG